MIDQKNLVFTECPLESNFVARSAHSSLNALGINKVNQNTCFKVGIVISLAAVANLPSLNQAAQAGTANFNLKLQNQPTTKEQGFSYIGQIQEITSFLPRIFSLITFSHQPLTTSVDDFNQITSTPVVTPPINQINQVNLIANRRKYHQAANIESSVTSPQLIHVVQKGDTINQIAKKYQVSKDELVKLNQIKNSNIIFVDQQLKIPASKISQISVNSAEQPETIVASAVTPETISQPTIPQQNSSNLGTKTVPENSPKLIREKLDPETVQDDPYITKLKAEIELLRAQNNSNNSTVSSLSSELNSEPNYQLDVAQEKSSNKVDPLFSPQANNNLQSNLLDENAIALTLPPLPSSEEYLPSAFDGYDWPAQGVLTSGYGMRWGRLHRGIDIAAPVGTPILAAATGEVVDVGWHGGYGNLVKLKHLDGSFTIYAHNHRNLVSYGQQVNQGEQIAEMGSTGYSTGSHLHFEIHSKNHEVINPLALLSRK